MKQLITLCVLLLAVSLQVQGQACEGVRVMPDLPDLNHEVSGVLYIENTTTYCIENFFYDGAGPDAFLYLYYPGDRTFIKGGGIITPVPGRENIREGQFEIGRRYTNERLRFEVPEGHRTCDYGGFGIWCRYAFQLFTVVSSMEVYFNTTVGEDGRIIMCTPSPGRAFLGYLPTDNNGISGDVFAVSDKQFTIRDFTYDGSGGDNVRFYFFPAGETASPMSTTGVSLNVEVAASEALDLVFPIGMYSCDYGTIALWDGNSASSFLASLTINIDTAFTNTQALADHDRSLVLCDRPTTRPGVLVGDLPNNGQGLRGTLYIQDDKTLYIQLFTYWAGGQDVYLYYYRRGQSVEDSGHGYRIGLSDSVEQLAEGMFYVLTTPFVVDLNNALDEDDVSACDLGWFTIWSEASQQHFTRIQFPTDIYTDDPTDSGIADKTRILCSQTAAVPTPRAGATPTAALVSGLTLGLIALVAMLLKA